MGSVLGVTLKVLGYPDARWVPIRGSLMEFQDVCVEFGWCQRVASGSLSLFNFKEEFLKNSHLSMVTEAGRHFAAGHLPSNISHFIFHNCSSEIVHNSSFTPPLASYVLLLLLSPHLCWFFHQGYPLSLTGELALRSREPSETLALSPSVL